MNEELTQYRQKLVLLIQERQTLRQQYGRHSLRAKVLDKDIRAAAGIYEAARRRRFHLTMTELRKVWGKRLGWDENDFNR